MGREASGRPPLQPLHRPPTPSSLRSEISATHAASNRSTRERPFLKRGEEKGVTSAWSQRTFNYFCQRCNQPWVPICSLWASSELSLPWAVSSGCTSTSTSTSTSRLLARLPAAPPGISSLVQRTRPPLRGIKQENPEDSAGQTQTRVWKVTCEPPPPGAALCTPSPRSHDCPLLCPMSP